MDQPVNISCLTMAAGIHVHAPQVKKKTFTDSPHLQIIGRADEEETEEAGVA